MEEEEEEEEEVVVVVEEEGSVVDWRAGHCSRCAYLPAAAAP